MLNQPYPKWATHYRFLNFPKCEQFAIPKQDLKTWFDLKFDLEDHVHIKHESIVIVVNNRKVYYEDGTLLEDVDLKATDVCLVLVQRHFSNENKKEEGEEVRYKEQSLSQTRLEIDKKRADPFFKQAMESIKISRQKQTLYDELVREFSKWECLMAFQKCRLADIRKYLQSGQAKKALQEKKFRDQEREIDEFLKKDDVMELKTELLSRRGDETLYAIFMRKLFDKYPNFRKLQIGHQEYVQIKLLGKELFEDSLVNRLENQIRTILQEVQRKKRPKILTEAELDSFTNPHILKGISRAQVSKAIRAAGNNLTLAEQYLQTGVVETAHNITLCLKKTARINLILQFFSQPAFEKILPKLRQKPQKCKDFIQHIITKYKASNKLLVQLIGQYKTYIQTILTGNYVVDKEKNLEHKSLKFIDQLKPNEEAAERQRILKTVDPRIVQALVKNNIEQGLATSVTRAAENDVRKLQPYLLLGGINRRYDFCNRTKDNEQIFLDKYFKKEKDLLLKLKNKQTEAITLGAMCETSPLLFDMIIRNKPFVDSLVAGK